MNSVKLTFAIIFVLMTLTQCSSTDPENSTEANNENMLWAKTVGNKAQGIDSLYFPNALKIYGHGELYLGASEIAEYWSNQKMSIKEIETTFSVIANNDSTYIYEIGSFNDDSGRNFAHLLIKNQGEGIPKRELEALSLYSATNIEEVKAEISDQRDRWMHYCNTHQVDSLVMNLYYPNAVYYNHRTPINDQSALIQEYGYMGNQQYSLKLIPLHLEVINEQVAFEIGQCEGSYNGKYMLMWFKDEQGEWKVLMDSNI
ncbi:MAG: hypothetical protein JJ895_01670 [Balneolaceae bacterium]|nr:hypothetical protein [Balneolaceae bacterium]